MESVLESVGLQWAQQDRKRRRQALASGRRQVFSAAASPLGVSRASSTTEPEPLGPREPEPLGPREPAADVHEALKTAAVQKRLYECLRVMINDATDRKVGSGAVFAARSAYAMFMTVQAVRPIPYGPQWAGALYICYHAVCTTFVDDSRRPHALHSYEALLVSDMRALARHMGMSTGHTGPVASAASAASAAPGHEALDEALMKDARKWERLPDTELARNMAEAWTVIADTPRVRMAVDSGLWPCHRAYLLFDHVNQR